MLNFAPLWSMLLHCPVRLLVADGCCASSSKGKLPVPHGVVADRTSHLREFGSSMFAKKSKPVSGGG
jgi:hypothetical protein